MEVYRLLFESDGFQTIWPKNDNEEIFDFNGKSVIKTWEPVEMEFKSKKKKGDCPCLFLQTPVFSENAIRNLDETVGENVEYLPLICPGRIKYFAVNVLAILDCIDYARAIPCRFPDGRIFDFDQYVFKEEVIKDRPIFKLLDVEQSEVFVTDVFKDKVIEANLQGFIFEKVS